MSTYIHLYSGPLSSKANKKGGCTVPWYNDPAFACLDHGRGGVKVSPHWKMKALFAVDSSWLSRWTVAKEIAEWPWLLLVQACLYIYIFIYIMKQNDIYIYIIYNAAMQTPYNSIKCQNNPPCQPKLIQSPRIGGIRSYAWAVWCVVGISMNQTRCWLRRLTLISRLWKWMWDTSQYNSTVLLFICVRAVI